MGCRLTAILSQTASKVATRIFTHHFSLLYLAIPFQIYLPDTCMYVVMKCFEIVEWQWLLKYKNVVKNWQGHVEHAKSSVVTLFWGKY